MNKEYIHWFMSKNFGFTPHQSDSIPYDKIIYLITLEQEWKKQELKLKENLIASAIGKAFKG